MTQILVNGKNLYFEHHLAVESSGRRPILFLHGLGSSVDDWKYQLDAFVNQFPIVLADLRGHGQSDCPEGPWSIADMASDMAELIENNFDGPLHVVGLSMGAQVAMQLALDYPDLLISVTAVNSPADMVPKLWQDRLKVLQRRVLVRIFGMRKVGEILSKRLFPGKEFAEVRQQFAQRWARNNPVAYTRALKAILAWDITSELHRIKHPLLVIAASEDYTPVVWKRRIVELAPNASLEIIENSRHATPMDQPDVFNQVLKEFLMSRCHE